MSQLKLILCKVAYLFSWRSDTFGFLRIFTSIREKFEVLKKLTLIHLERTFGDVCEKSASWSGQTKPLDSRVPFFRTFEG